MYINQSRFFVWLCGTLEGCHTSIYGGMGSQASQIERTPTEPEVQRKFRTVTFLKRTGIIRQPSVPTSLRNREGTGTSSTKGVASESVSVNSVAVRLLYRL
jgi:hypothetical protein